MQGKETSAPLHQQAVLHILLIPYLPLHLLLLLIILLHLIILLLFLIIIYSSSLYSSFSSSFSKFGKPPGSPASPAFTCRTGTGMSTYKSGLLLPPGSKIIIGSRLFTGYTIFTGFTGITRHQCSDCLINFNTLEKYMIHCKKSLIHWKHV